MSTNLYLENYEPAVKWARQVESKFGASFGGAVTSLSTILDESANATLTSGQGGSTVLLDVASGATITLPAPKPGLLFCFSVVTTVTSNSYKVITDAGTTLMIGWLGVPVAAGTQKLFFADGSTLLSINLNGTTTGGLQGGYFECRCVTSTLWQVNGNVEGSGVVATPFATS